MAILFLSILNLTGPATAFDLGGFLDKVEEQTNKSRRTQQTVEGQQVKEDPLASGGLRQNTWVPSPKAVLFIFLAIFALL